MTVVGVVVNLVTLPMIAHRFEIFIIVKRKPIMMMNTLRWSRPLKINQRKHNKPLNKKNSRILSLEPPPLQKKAVLYLAYANFSIPMNRKKKNSGKL